MRILTLASPLPPCVRSGQVYWRKGDEGRLEEGGRSSVVVCRLSSSVVVVNRAPATGTTGPRGLRLREQPDSRREKVLFLMEMELSQ